MDPPKNITMNEIHSLQTNTGQSKNANRQLWIPNSPTQRRTPPPLRTATTRIARNARTRKHHTNSSYEFEDNPEFWDPSIGSGRTWSERKFPIRRRTSEDTSSAATGEALNFTPLTFWNFEFGEEDEGGGEGEGEESAPDYSNGRDWRIHLWTAQGRENAMKATNTLFTDPTILAARLKWT